VGRERLARAAALLQFGYVGQQVLAPAIAGALLGTMPGGISGIIAIDAGSYALALAATLATPLPPGGASTDVSWRAQLSTSFALIRRSGLLSLSLYLAAT